MYLLDTDTLTLIHLGHPRLTQRRGTVPSSEIATTIITRLEILQGRFAAVLKAVDGEKLLRAQALLIRTEQRFSEVPVVTFDAAAAAEFDRLRPLRKLRKIGRNALLIASIARANLATLVARNVKHFHLVPGLDVENWAD